MTQWLAMAIVAWLISGGLALAGSTDSRLAQAPLSAQASNPKSMGWMQGFPPALDGTIRFTDADFFALPKLRWTICHFRALMPTAGVRNGTTGASPLPVAQYLIDTIWNRIGAEREAFYTVDSIGTLFAGGGFNATLRDMARLGLLVLNDGRWNGQQIIPATAIERIREGGVKSAFATPGYDMPEGWSYRGMWWVTHDRHGAFAARGVHGQTIWIDPAAQMVIVRFASTLLAANAASDPTSLPAFRAVADYLMAHDAAHGLAGTGRAGAKPAEQNAGYHE